MIETVISWNAHSLTTNYEVDFIQGTEPGLPPAQAAMLTRIGAWPVVAALQRNPKRIALLIKITDYANVNTLRSTLFRWFDPEDETPKKLIVTNHAGVQQYVMALCEGLQLYSDPRHQEAFVATLSVDGDVRWRAETAIPDTWPITASAQTRAITNGGEDEVYPVYTIKPTTVKGGSYTYRRWVAIQWLSANAGQVYPVVATLATNALIPAKMQIDGDDLRVLVDGVEVNRWLDAINTASTKIWFYTDFVGAPALTLKTAIAGAGSIASIELNEDISQLPNTGILYIGTEAFVYSARNTTDKLVSGVERAAKGTSAGAHNSGNSVYWIQHDIYLLYGNAAATAPTVDAHYKPAFELDHSTNDSWVYETFGQQDAYQGSTIEYHIGRWGRWGNITLSGVGGGGVYTATQRSRVVLGNPFLVAGAWIYATCGSAFGWYLENPCGITNAVWTNGLKRRASTNPPFDFVCEVMNWVRGDNWWDWMYTVPSPTVVNTWQAWNYGGAAFDVSNVIALALYFYPSDVEVGDVTVTLNNAETPVVTVGPEQGNYHLQATLTNTTTGESITLNFVMDVNSSLEIDTTNKTVIWLLDGSRQFQALSTGGTRATPLAKRQWLRLLPGSNTLRFDDTNTGNVTLTTSFRERYY